MPEGRAERVQDIEKESVSGVTPRLYERATQLIAKQIRDGTLPASAVAAAVASPAHAPSMLSLLDRISKACLGAQLPADLLDQPEFEFLADGGKA